jgi:hypothetical protein
MTEPKSIEVMNNQRKQMRQWLKDGNPPQMSREKASGTS